MTYQQIIVVGNVGRDPELKYTQSGTAVTDFPVATNRRYRDREGNQQERTTWWRVTCWGRQAEFVAQYVKKGRQVLVSASRIEANAFMGRDNEPRASLDITADDVQLLGNRNDNFDTGNEPDVAGGQYGNDKDFKPPNEVNDIPF